MAIKKRLFFAMSLYPLSFFANTPFNISINWTFTIKLSLGKLGGYLQSADSIEEQVEILVASVCPLLDDPAGCQTGVETWWEGIGKVFSRFKHILRFYKSWLKNLDKSYFCLALAMYPVFLEANSVCGILGACGLKSVVKAPTCDECSGSIAAVAGVIESEAQIAEIIEFLKVIHL